MSVICKFRVTEVSLAPYGGWKEEPKVVGRRVKMYPVQGEPFGRATPSGNLEMLIVNPKAADQFELDGEYEVVFTKVKSGLPIPISSDYKENGES